MQYDAKPYMIVIKTSSELAAVTSVTLVKGLDKKTKVVIEAISGTFWGSDETDLACSINIKDSTSLEDWFTDDMDIRLFAGIGQKPYRLERPIVLEGGSTITVKLTNDHASTAGNLVLVLHGWKVME